MTFQSKTALQKIALQTKIALQAIIHVPYIKCQYPCLNFYILNIYIILKIFFLLTNYFNFLLNLSILYDIVNIQTGKAIKRLYPQNNETTTSYIHMRAAVNYW